MNAKDAIRFNLNLSEMLLNKYVGDLEDADLLVRPVDGMNHMAWQLGHLISAERMFVESIKPGASPALPEGFDDAHNKEAAASSDKAKFRSKAEYLKLFNAQRAATKALLENLSDAELDTPSPERFRQFIPTAGDALNMCGSHIIMHAGQFVPVRRLGGKPIVI